MFALPIPVFQLFVIRLLFFFFPGAQGFKFFRCVVPVKLIETFDGIADAEKFDFTFFIEFDIEGIASASNGTVFIYRAEIVFSKIFTAIFVPPKAHNAPSGIQFDPSRLPLSPFYLTRFVKIDDFLSGLSGMLHDTLNVPVRNKNDWLFAAVGATRTPEIKKMFPFLSQFKTSRW